MSVELDVAVSRLKIEEGYREKAYKDTVGHWTIGYGFNIDAGMPERVAAACLREYATMVEEELSGFDWYKILDANRRSVLIDMAYNMGEDDLLHFHNTLLAVSRKDWQAAHDGMLASKWATQVGVRAQRLANIMLTGELT